MPSKYEELIIAPETWQSNKGRKKTQKKTLKRAD